MIDSQRIVYSLNVADIQEVAEEDLGRPLTADELKIVEDNLSGYIDSRQAIWNAIHLDLKWQEEEAEEDLL
jgi:hypothetical protein